MRKFGNLFQVAYIVFAIFFAYEAIVLWNTERGKAYLSIGIALIAIFKFFFNRKYRKRFEEHYKKREEERN